MRVAAVLVLSAVCFVMIGCSKNHQGAKSVELRPGIPGSIVLDILQSNEPDRSTLIELTPAVGRMKTITENLDRQVTAEHLSRQEVLIGTGALIDCKTNPVAVSPDGQFVATCIRQYDRTGKYGGGSTGIVVSRQTTHQILWSRSFDHDSGWRVDGFGWNPEVSDLAIVTTSSTFRSGILSIMLGFFGHPIPNETVRISLVSMADLSATEYIVGENLEYSSSRLLRWQH